MRLQYFGWSITSGARQLRLGKRGRALQTVAEKADITSVTNVISAFDVYRLSAIGSFSKALLSRVTVLFQIKSLNQIPIKKISSQYRYTV